MNTKKTSYTRENDVMILHGGHNHVTRGFGVGKQYF